MPLTLSKQAIHHFTQACTWGMQVVSKFRVPLIVMLKNFMGLNRIIV